MDKYIIKMIVTDGKIKFYKIYHNNKLIKTTSKQETHLITKQYRLNNIQIKKVGNDKIIDDQTFIKNYAPIPNSTITHNNKFKGVAVLSGAAFIYVISSFINPKSEIKVVQNVNVEAENSLDDFTYDESNDSNEIENIEQTIDEDTTYFLDYEDRSNNDYQIYEKYGLYIDKYSKMYGLDPNLVMAIITQENKNNLKNYSNIGGHGLMQVESIWNNCEVTAYNFDTNNFEKQIININEINNNDEYGIKIGCMIFNNYYNYICNNFSNKLNKKECLIATIFGYNKGIGIVSKCIQNSSNFNECIDLIKSSNGGDNEYIEHVLSYLKDDTTLCVRSLNDTSKTTIKNTSYLSTKKR